MAPHRRMALPSSLTVTYALTLDVPLPADVAYLATGDTAELFPMSSTIKFMIISSYELMEIGDYAPVLDRDDLLYLLLFGAE